MLSEDTIDAIRLFHMRREARLRQRLAAAGDLMERYRLLKAIYTNRRSAARMFGERIIYAQPLDIGGKSYTIKFQNTSADGGPGSGNHGHKGVPGQIGGSAPRGGAVGRSKFPRKGSTIEVTSDVKVKIGKNVVKLKAGSVITQVEDFAGAGFKRGVDVEPHLIEQIGGSAGEWTKAKGISEVVIGGKKKSAELHWFEHPIEGQAKMKVKKFVKHLNEE